MWARISDVFEIRTMHEHGGLMCMFFLGVLLLAGEQLLAQGVAAPGGVCKPASERTQDVGCWILADEPLGQLKKSRVFWHLDAYSTRAEAQADKGPHGTVVESLGKVLLMTVEEKNWRPAHGTRVAEIGPLPIVAGEKYSAQYMEAIFSPGMTAPAHIHSGPEAWYTLAGETCLETSDNRVQIGRAGGPPVIVPEGLAMHLTATGTQQRRAMVLILHESSKPASTMVHDWTPKGMCKNEK
jgi:quercetin dioxygenase-like cupin family protein